MNPRSFFDIITSNLENDSMPQYNILDLKNEYIIEIAVPGLERDELSITVSGKTLTVFSKLKERPEKFRHREIFRRNFSIKFLIDDTIKGKSANLENGILSIVIPKVEKDTETIEINATDRQLLNEDESNVDIKNYIKNYNNRSSTDS